MESILTSIKKLLGIEEQYEQFDPDIIICINTALAALAQIGAVPGTGYSITDKTAVWTDILGDDKRLELVKSYVHLRVRLLFDPPPSSSVIEVINKTIAELEWRILAVTDFGGKEADTGGK